MLRKCTTCGLEAHTEDDLDLFEKDKQRPHGRANRCKACSSIRATEYKKRNPEQERDRLYAWREENKEAVSRINKKHYQNNKHKYYANNAKRRGLQQQATPAWFVQEKKRIEFLYATSKMNGLHVDHIVPLNHDLVCGLHCLSNLQLLEPVANLSKKNSFRP